MTPGDARSESEQSHAAGTSSAAPGSELSPAQEIESHADPPREPAAPLNEEQKERAAESWVRQGEAQAQRADDDRTLRKELADKVFKAAAIQVLLADAVFAVYGFYNDWDIPGSTMSAWLAAAVVQVVAVALVIARSLFPSD